MSVSQETWLDRARRYLGQELWSSELRPRSLTAAGVRALQLVVMICEGFVRDQLLLRASALTYIAAVALIPLLVVVFSLVRAFGMGEDLVVWAVGQVAVGTPEARDQILALVSGANLGALGSVGAAMVLITTILALRHAETTLNEIWGVRRSRTWMRRLADYLLVIVIVPVVTSTALSLDATLRSAWIVNELLELPGFRTVYGAGLLYMPALLLVAGFSFIYWFLPNTHVRALSALLGGLVAAVLFVVAQRLFLEFIVNAARYNVFFGSFAAIPLILFWLYLSFALVLLGAEVSYAHQNLALYRREVQGEPPGPAEREAVGLRIAAEVGRCFRERRHPPDAADLSETLNVPVRTVRDLLDRLESAGLVAPLAGADGVSSYQLGAPAETIRVSELLEALRGRRDPGDGTSATCEAVDGLLDDLEGAVATVADQRTLADVLADVPSASRPERA